LLNTTVLRIAAPSTVHLTCPRDSKAIYSFRIKSNQIKYKTYS
jgi:hypothetical protein